ncbi:siderophore iron transporter mirB [Colletotrichum cereale]|nr:siderophore iron transporter mirB [Colletotrichum cereale]
MPQAETPAVLSPVDNAGEKDVGSCVLELGPEDSPTESIDKNAQAGVQQVEAIATVWSKKTLIVVYIFIWIAYFVMLMQQAASTALVPYVASAFLLHSLTPTVSILSSVIGGVCNLTVAKIIDVFGRPHGYAAALVISTLGLVMMAATTSVEMYASAQVFWTIGNNALGYILSILVADTTSLRNRGVMLALTASPNMITIWLGGPISEVFLKGPGWQWCYGAFSIIMPVLCIPVYGVLAHNCSKAIRQGVIPGLKPTRTTWQSFLHYSREFDVVGLLLITAGLALFLLPFNLYGYQPLGWRSPLILCLLVLGVVLMILFAAWERFFAPTTFIPYDVLLNRNMIGACGIGFALFFSYFTWFSYFSSALQVVYGASIAEASYISQISGLGGGISAIATGVVIRYTGRYKAITLYGAVPTYSLFTGLMIYFQGKGKGIGYIVMCQIFISFASGVMTTTPTIAAMSAISHQNIAVVVAVVSMFSSIGGAIGLTVSGAIWQASFPVKLAEYLPLDALEDLLNIYASLEVQLSYPVGTPVRIATQRAYADSQSLLLIAGTSIWVVGFAATAL